MKGIRRKSAYLPHKSLKLQRTFSTVLLYTKRAAIDWGRKKILSDPRGTCHSEINNHGNHSVTECYTVIIIQYNIIKSYVLSLLDSEELFSIMDIFKKKLR